MQYDTFSGDAPFPDEPEILVDNVNFDDDLTPCDDPFVIREFTPLEGGTGYFDLRPYQHEGVEAVYQSWQRHRSTIVVCATGLGKTIMFSEVALRWPEEMGRVLVIAHREELIDQAAEKMGIHLQDERIAIEMGERRELRTSQIFGGPSKILVASIQTLSRPKRREKHRKGEFGLIIVDECFVPGTLIDGRPIEEIRLGDVVSCFNHESGLIELKPVTHVFANPAKRLVRITFSDGREVVCTENHPIFTDDGYVAAGILQCGDMVLTITENENGDFEEGVRSVRNCICSEKLDRQDGSNLLASMQTRSTRSPEKGCHSPVLDLRKNCRSERGEWSGKGKERSVLVFAGMRQEEFFSSDGGNESSSRFEADERKQSDEQAGHPGKGFDVSSRERLDADDSWRKWVWRNCTAAIAGVCSWLGYGSRCENLSQKRMRVSDCVQDRHCKQNPESGNRSQREFAQNHDRKRSGRKEKFGVVATRVDCVEFLERGSDGEFERLCPEGLVYNFGVEKHHNYFANGILVHNCHHSTANSYREVVAHYLALNPQARLLGVTATPYRGDKKSLGDIFENVSYDMDILEGIDEGWLVDIEQKLVVVEGLDFSKCRTTAGDVNQKDLASVMMGGTDHVIETDGEATALQMEAIEQQEKMLHAVVGPTLAEAAGRPTLVFCVTKAHAERMTEIFQRHPGVTAEFVTDDTSSEERKRIIREFKSRQIQVLVGVGVFLEGFDARVDVVVMARPTKSKSVYVQAVGRGTRPLPNTVDNLPTAKERRESILASDKPHMTVLDFVGNSGKHTLVSTMDLLGGEYEEEVIEAARRKLLDGESAVVSDLLKQTKDELDENKRKQAMEKAERERLAKEREDAERERRRLEAENRKQIRAQVQYSTKQMSIKGAVIPEIVGEGLFRGGSTDAQVKHLIKLGMSHEHACALNRVQASGAIGKLLSLTGPEFRVSFGKYAGFAFKQVPSGYLDWAINNLERNEHNGRFLDNIIRSRAEKSLVTQ